MVMNKVPSAVAAHSSPYRWFVLLLALLIQISVSLVQQASSALAPILTHDLGFSRTQIGLLYGATYAGMALATIPVGIMVDRRGERPVVLAGIAVMGLLALSIAGTSSFLPFFIILLLTGMGGATSSPGGTKALSTWFPRRQWGLAMGIRQTGVTVGGLIGALTLPPLAAHYGWHAGLVAVGVFSLISLAGFAVFYREVDLEQVRRRTIPYRALLRNRPLLGMTAYGFIANGTQGCALSYIALYAHQDLGISIAASGVFLALVNLGGIGGRIGWGTASDRFGRRGPMLALVSLIAILSFLALTFVNTGTPLVLFGGLCLVLGASAVGWNGLFFTIIAENTGEAGAATGLSFGLMGAYVSPITIPPLFGLIADRTGTYHIPWIGAAAWAVLGLLIAWWVSTKEQGRVQVHRSP